MALIVSRNGKDAKRIARTSFDDEAELQRYLYENPEVIPLNDIDEDIRLLILAREFQTESGPIDAVGVDADGQLYLIETKLYKNQDKRHVVAQVLDYGASLWRHYGDFDTFRAALESKVQEKWKMSLEEKLTSFFDLAPEDLPELLASMRGSLDEGSFKFVVLMDQLHDRLKDLIRFINRYSRFGLFAVEVEYYKHEDYEIMIPRLFGAEVKKDLLVARSRNLQTHTVDEHFEGSCAAMRPTYDKLLAAIEHMQPAIEVDPKQQYIAFRVDGKRIFSLITRKTRLILWFPGMQKEDFNDPKTLVEQQPDNYPSITIRTDADIANAVEIIRQAMAHAG